MTALLGPEAASDAFTEIRLKKRYTSRVLLILVAFGVAVFGVVRLARPLEPGQRVVLVLVCIAGLVLLILKLVQLGILGRATPTP